MTYSNNSISAHIVLYNAMLRVAYIICITFTFTCIYTSVIVVKHRRNRSFLSYFASLKTNDLVCKTEMGHIGKSKDMSHNLPLENLIYLCSFQSPQTISSLVVILPRATTYVITIGYSDDICRFFPILQVHVHLHSV